MNIVHVLTAILRAAVLTQDPRSPRAALLLLVVPAMCVVTLFPGAFFERIPFPPDGHAHIALNEAINARYCGRAASLTTRYNIGASLVADSRLLSRSFRDIIILHAGSVEAYCRTIDLDFLNNENSTGLLMRAGLWLLPNPSPLRMGRFLAAVRLCCILVFAFALLLGGTSVWLTTVAVAAAAQIGHELSAFAYSIYSFLIPLLLAAAALYATALSAVRGRAAVLWTAALGAGFFTGFCVNMRSSHLPVYLAMFFLFLAGALRRLSVRRPAMVGVLSIVLFAAGYVGFNRIFIARLAPQGPVLYHNFSHHVIAHPLVLALAVPETPFSHQEGIAWNDATGIDLARRMIPDAVYLGPGYEQGLLLYYMKLWLIHPESMRAVYATKFRIAGTGIFTQPGLAGMSLVRILRRLPHITSGWWLLLLIAAVGAVAGAVFWRRQGALAFVMLELSVVAGLLLLESAIIMSIFYLQYHGFLLLFLFMLLPITAQILVDVTIRSWRRGETR